MCVCVCDPTIARVLCRMVNYAKRRVFLCECKFRDANKYSDMHVPHVGRCWNVRTKNTD